MQKKCIRCGTEFSLFSDVPASDQLFCSEYCARHDKLERNADFPKGCLVRNKLTQHVLTVMGADDNTVYVHVDDTCFNDIYDSISWDASECEIITRKEA